MAATNDDLIAKLKKVNRDLQLNSTDEAKRPVLEAQFEKEDLEEENERLLSLANESAKKEKAATLASEYGVPVEELLEAKNPDQMEAMALRKALEKLKVGDKKEEEEEGDGVEKKPEDKKTEGEPKSKPKTTTAAGVGSRGGPEIDYKSYQGQEGGLVRLWSDLIEKNEFINVEIQSK